MSPILKVGAKSKKRNDEVSILFRVRNGRNYDYVAQSTKQIRPEYWNNKTGKIREVAGFIDAERFQKELEKLRRSILA